MQHNNLFLNGMIVLKRVCAAKRINRWYSITIQQTLLDSISIVCRYGNRRNSWQKTWYKSVESKEEAEKLAAKIVASKIKRGYVIIDDLSGYIE